MKFHEDISKRKWSWEEIAHQYHVRLTDGRMLRVRETLTAFATATAVLELITKTGIVEIAQCSTKARIEWLQSYGEYVFAGQNYVDV